MKFVYLTHSLQSCWNHGNAHFVRGVVRALMAEGHEVDVWEPRGGWSLSQLEAEQGEAALAACARAFPELSSRFYDLDDLEAMVDSADIVIVHEWTEPAVVSALGRLRRREGGFHLLFHDTHHRAVSDPASIDRAALADYDGVLAFGQSLAEIYRGWGMPTWTWHEAADISHFHPRGSLEREGIVWIGNWGDEERTAELESYLFAPAEAERLPLTVRGVRYPAEALRRLAKMGAHYGGWIANVDAPALFSRFKMTVHVPRSFYLRHLPGIPTIRVFEALACGIPLISAWWPDEEGLFCPGDDFLVARSGTEMRRHMRALAHDADLRRTLAASGLETIHARHTCRHRAMELLDIADGLRASRLRATA